MAKIIVKIVDVKGTEVAEQAFLNLPMKAAEVLEQLSAAGYAGSLLDEEGSSLSGEDKVDEMQVYRLVLPCQVCSLTSMVPEEVAVAHRAPVVFISIVLLW